MAAAPARGDIWLVDLNPTRGHEQAGRCPALIVSTNMFNYGPADLVIVLPITRTSRGIPFHVEVMPSEGGLRERSFVKCEDVRSVSAARLLERWGTVSPHTLTQVEDRLRILLEL